MTAQEMKVECGTQKWVPILVIREKDRPIVPVFEDPHIAMRFARRNLPEEWFCGTVELDIRDAKWMDKKGWQAIKFTYPRVLKDVFVFDVEILEYEPDQKLIMRI
jgi:hypothetical protein